MWNHKQSSVADVVWLDFIPSVQWDLIDTNERKIIVGDSNCYSLYQTNSSYVWKSKLGTRPWMSAQLWKIQHRSSKKWPQAICIFSVFRVICILVRHHNPSCVQCNLETQLDFLTINHSSKLFRYNLWTKYYLCVYNDIFWWIFHF